MNEVAVDGDDGIVRPATQDINGAAGEVVGSAFAGKLRPGVWFRHAAARPVFIECALQGAEQQVALGAVGIHDAKTGVGLAVGRFEEVADFGDISDLTAKDETFPGPDVGFQESRILTDRLGNACAAVEVVLNGREQGLEAVEILAPFTVGDLLCGALFGTGANMAKLGDVGRPAAPSSSASNSSSSITSTGAAATAVAPASNP